MDAEHRPRRDQGHVGGIEGSDGVKAVALANIFGGGSGMTLATTDDPLLTGFISMVTARGEELIDEKIDLLARAIRAEIADAWNKGQKKGGSDASP